MGMLDIPGISRAQGDGRYNPNGGHAATLMSKLAAGRESAVLTVLGDSTGDETNVQGRWPLLLAQNLAAMFPAYTVNFRQWNLINGTIYDPLGTNQSRVLHVGTGTGNAGGPFVLDFYNGSASGTAPAYNIDVSRWIYMNPAVPDLVIVNHGHNMVGSTGAQANYLLYQLTRAIRERYPSAGLIVTAQNPMNLGQADQANDLLRARSFIAFAARENYGLINVLQPFLNNPTFNANWLLDGLHPNAAGSLIWLAEVMRHFQAPSLTCAPPKSPDAQQNKLWLPAQRFGAFAGDPVLALTNSEAFMWAFPQAAVSSVCATEVLPAHWDTYDSWLYWTVAGSAGYTPATLVSWRLLRQQQGYSSILPAEQVSYPPAAWLDPGAQNKNPNNGSAYQTVCSQIGQQSANTRAPGGFRVQRTGNNGTDNIAETAYMLGLLLVRAS